jgi:hypothetical protein
MHKSTAQRSALLFAQCYARGTLRSAGSQSVLLLLSLRPAGTCTGIMNGYHR